jgi:hypothetical protein
MKIGESIPPFLEETEAEEIAAAAKLFLTDPSGAKVISRCCSSKRGCFCRYYTSRI